MEIEMMMQNCHIVGRQIFKIHLGAKYIKVEKVNVDKNSNNTKLYRKYVAIKLLSHFDINNLMISIDETNFLSANKHTRAWIITDSALDYRLLLIKLIITYRCW